MYGPVRTVVWEGSGRKACPYPDFKPIEYVFALGCAVALVLIWPIKLIPKYLYKIYIFTLKQSSGRSINRLPVSTNV